MLQHTHLPRLAFATRCGGHLPQRNSRCAKPETVAVVDQAHGTKRAQGGMLYSTLRVCA